MQTHKNVLYITTLPSPYIVDYLNELGKICNLTAVFERAVSTTRDKSWRKYRFVSFKGFFLKGISVDSDQVISFGVLKYLKKKKYDGIIIANPCTFVGILATTYLKLNKRKYILESEGGLAKNGKGIKEKIKKMVLSGATLYFSTGKTGDEYFCTYGAPAEKLVHFPFTTLYQNEILKKALTTEEKNQYKQKVGCHFPFMVLSIGQFIPRKGMDILMRACENLPSCIKIVIIGGQPTDEYLSLKNELKLQNVEFISFSNKQCIMDYYKAADVFALATREDTWGLVIPEAMSFGVPVISTDKCVAALSLIEEGENGFIIPNENITELHGKILELYNDVTIRNKMSQNNLTKMKDYSLEKMAMRQIEEIEKINDG